MVSRVSEAGRFLDWREGGMLFAEFVEIAEPTREHLVMFVGETVELLRLAVDSDDLADRLFRKDAAFREMARGSFHTDVIPAAQDLQLAINNIPDEQLERHGLLGSAARFKYGAIARLAEEWRVWRGRLTAALTFRHLLEAVDALLDSLIQAAGGIGAVLKEFKDATMALAAG